MRPALHYERLLGRETADAELVLLHGWGSSARVWRAALPYLRRWCNVTLVELPGLGGPGEGDSTQLESLLDGLLACAPERAAWVGWSLGGQLATLVAARAPRRVAALATIASNPCFIARGDWPGVPEPELAQLREALARDPSRALRRFEALQARDCTDAAVLRRALAECRGQVDERLRSGLDWLARLDTRDSLRQLDCPQLHLQAANDPLAPPALVASLRDLLASPDGPERRVVRLPDAGHALPLQCPRALASALADFLGPQLPAAPAASGNRPAKQAVAASFSRAATNYDRAAQLQRKVGERLVQRLPRRDEPRGVVLDLGCGTAYFQPALAARLPGWRYIGLDLAQGMLTHARALGRGPGEWVAGDAEQLPLASASVDVVFSSLAIQWCARPEAVFAELARVLRPGGHCLFSTLGPDTLHELRSAWAAVDGRTHVNDFLPPENLQAAAAHLPGLALRLEREPLCLGYAQLRGLFDELKGIGAHNMNNGRPPGLGGRRALQGMMAAYEQFREGGQLPATYDVVYGHLERV